MSYKKSAKIIFDILVYLFAIIGFVLVVGYFAVKFGFTNTKGIIDNQKDFFTDQVKNDTSSSPDFIAPSSVASSTSSASQPKPSLSQNQNKKVYAWNRDPEWLTFSAAVAKDQEAINRASLDASISPRILVSSLIVEQLRLFYTSREVYKSVFQPLQILGSQSQFSWGVMGIKQDTAIAVEQNLKNPTSPFYLGAEYEHLLDFTSNNPDQERFARITDEHDHYYAYLYGALYMKQIMVQWQRAGYDISHSPGVTATLYNIGFSHSEPKANPAVGGAKIDIGTTAYSFGGLASEFYYSGEMMEYFPR